MSSTLMRTTLMYVFNVAVGTRVFSYRVFVAQQQKIPAAMTLTGSDTNPGRRVEVKMFHTDREEIQKVGRMIREKEWWWISRIVVTGILIACAVLVIKTLRAESAWDYTGLDNVSPVEEVR